MGSFFGFALSTVAVASRCAAGGVSVASAMRVPSCSFTAACSVYVIFFAAAAFSLFVAMVCSLVCDVS